MEFDSNLHLVLKLCVKLLLDLIEEFAKVTTLIIKINKITLFNFNTGTTN